MKRGRPPIEESKSEKLYIRVQPKRKEEIMKFADEHGYSLLGLVEKGIATIKSEEGLDEKS